MIVKTVEPCVVLVDTTGKAWDDEAIFKAGLAALGRETVEQQIGRGCDGIMLNNDVFKYRVASVNPAIAIISTIPLTPDQTRQMARAHVGAPA
jgi:hypothetical protein